MAYLDPQTNTFQQNIDILQNGPQQPSNIVDLSQAQDQGQAGGASSPTASQGPSSTSAPTTQGSTPSPVQTITPGREGSIYQRLFSPVQQATSSDTASLGQQYGAFQKAAGPSRTYESSGAQNTLNQAISPAPQATSPDYQKYQDNYKAAQGLVGAKYAGPQNLQEASPQDWASLNEALNRLYSTSNAFSTGQGLGDFVAQAVPGLTTGERQFEAQRLMQDPTFRAQLETAQKGVSDLKAQQAAQMGQAEAFAQQRTQEEADIAKKSQDYLGGQKADWLTAEQAKVDAGLARQKAVEDAWAKFQAGGQLPPELTSGIPHTEYDHDARQAKAVWDKVQSQFQDIKDIPLMTLAIDGQGREQYVFPGGWKDNGIYPKGFTGADAKRIRQRAMARQQALEAAGFSPGNKQMKLPAGAKNYIDAPMGQYAAYAPLYFGDTGHYTPEDLRKFSSLYEGTTPTLANQATSDELAKYNAILDLLGQNEQQLYTPQAGEEYHPAQVAIDTKGYTAAEKQALDRISKALKDASVKEELGVNRARRKYKQSRNIFGGSQVIGSGLGGQIGGIAGAVSGGGLLSFPAYLGGKTVGGAIGGLL